MNFESVIDGGCTPIVKNTFLEFKIPDPPTLQRCSSAPALPSRPEEQGEANCVAPKIYLNGIFVSDTAADVLTDASTCSECGTNTPSSCCFSCMDDAASPRSACSMNFTTTPVRQAASRLISQGQRLNSKAIAFQPKADVNDPAMQHYGPRFAEVINCAKKIMQASECIKCVQLDDTNGYTLILQPQHAAEGSGQQTQQLMTIAKEAILEASSKSKCIYVQGYAGLRPFTMKPQGFEATLTAMENARNACWHIFKKGFCRHGDACSKQHPVCQQTVQVVVENSSFDGCGVRFVKAFRQEVTALAMMITATMGRCAYADNVEAHENKGCVGWTIEVTPKEEMKMLREYLLNLAQSALFGATNDSNTVYIMGYAAKPFFSKPNGFVTILGDMQDESRACWDFYSKGFCTRDCACSWEHPECCMPFNIVIKERSTIKLSATMKE